MNSIDTTSVDTYINSFPEDVGQRLQAIRAALTQAFPVAIEVISYQMPGIKLGKKLLSYGAYNKQIGVYPVSAGNETYMQQLAPYLSGKSTAKFPFSEALPLSLIVDMAKYRFAL